MMEVKPMNTKDTIQKNCSYLLGHEIDPDVSLVAQGATSMKLMQLVGKLYEEYGVIIDITDLLEDVSVNTICSLIEKDAPDVGALADSEYSTEVPLNQIQLLFWDMQEFKPCKKAYNEGVSHLVIGELDIDACKQTIHKLVQRHPALRASYYLSDSKPVQKVIEYSEIKDKIDIEIYDYRSDENPIAVVRESHRELYTTDFDLATPPNFRVVMWRIDDNQWVISWVVFHIVTDWWAVDILRKEAAQIYKYLVTNDNEAIEKLDKEIKPSKYDIGSNEINAEDEKYWKSCFENPLVSVDLSTEKRPPIKLYSGDVHLAELSNVDYSQLENTRRQLGVTMSSLVFAAFNVLSSAISNETDMVTGVPFLNRQDPEVQNMVGIFINSLPIRINVNKESSVSEFILNCHQVLVSAYKHGKYPARLINTMIEKKSSLSRSPLYEQLFTYYENTLVKSSYDDLGLTAEEIELPRGTAKYDIAFFVMKQRDSLCTKVEYSTALFKENDIDNFIQGYQKVLKEIIRNRDMSITSLINKVRDDYHDIRSQANESAYSSGEA